MARTNSNLLYPFSSFLTPSAQSEGVMSIWTYLQQAGRPVVLYGTGNGADKILDRLAEHDIPVSGVFASSEFVRDRSFRGFRVETYDALHSRFPNMIVLVCFGTSRPEVLGNIERIAAECEVFAPDVPVYGDNLFDDTFFLEHEAELNQVYAELEDDLSRATLNQIVRYKLSGDYRLLRSCERPLSDHIDLLQDKFDPDGYFVDLGAYTGDTVEYYSSAFANEISKVLAVEPDGRNFRKLQETSQRLTTPSLAIHCTRALISDRDGVVHIDRNKGRGVHIQDVQAKKDAPQATSSAIGEEITAARLVTLLQGEKASLIKMDVEGAELAAISGGETIIQRDRPALIVSCYHRNEDLFTLPLRLKALVPEYKIYMRHHPHLLSWDTEYILTT